MTRDTAAASIQTELGQAFGILSQPFETESEFRSRLASQFGMEVVVPQADGLPAFSADCDPEDSENLGEAVTVINEANINTAYDAWLKAQSTEACMEIDLAYDAAIDMDQLTQKQLMRQQLYQDWYDLDTTKPQGETLDQFIERIKMNYAIANPPAEDSGVIIPDYPEDCDIYVMMIEASKQALVDYKATLDECIRFDKWANPIVDPLRTA